MRLTDNAVTRLTSHPAIDTEPSWSPDGSEIVFTSDRSGKPQIYRMRADGSDVQRVTFEGEYNARASFAPGNSNESAQGDIDWRELRSRRIMTSSSAQRPYLQPSFACSRLCASTTSGHNFPTRSGLQYLAARAYHA